MIMIPPLVRPDAGALPAGPPAVADSLAWARTGRRYRVTRVPLADASAQSRRLGVHEGDVLTCTANGRCAVYLRRGGRRLTRVERDYAVWIGVEPL